MPTATPRELALDRVFAALANHERRTMLRQLRRGPVETPVIAASFDFSKQALSRHLAVLEEAGLIDRTARGRMHSVSLAPRPLDDVSAWISELRRGWQSSLERLDRVLQGSS
ncbi:MAG TPA: metalloregulator ArsR/SmtB family transcription factor [Candidatus Cybelea sp.]|jgi:DNA-binding transcriptional ArsR family regulator|nr:metalloregulator ArsR/SmtB family transcription factor [Candidatus Cybelea sp.]